MKKFLLALIVLSLILPLGMTQAQEPGSPEDNACYEGGVMAGQCTTEWHWVCGYYLAQFFTRSYNQGGYNTALLPDWCASLLPPRPAPAPVAPAAATVTGSISCNLATISRPFYALGRPATSGVYVLSWTSTGADSGFAINGAPVPPSAIVPAVAGTYTFTHEGTVLGSATCGVSPS